MKQVLIAALIIIPLVFLSCKKDIDDPSIVGKWDYYNTREFDFTNSGDLNINNGNSKQSFKYTVKDGVITIDAKGKQYSYDKYYYSYTLTGDKMILKAGFSVLWGDYFDGDYELVRK